MALMEGNNSELFVTALSGIFEDLEISEIEKEKDDSLQPLSSFKNFFDNRTDELSSSTPKRPYQGFIRKRFLLLKDADSPASAPSRTPEEVAKLVLPPKKPESPLPQLPPVVLTPWSKIIRDAILAKEEKLKKAMPAGKPRMSMRV